MNAPSPGSLKRQQFLLGSADLFKEEAANRVGAICGQEVLIS
jgi:hypothetical protein